MLLFDGHELPIAKVLSTSPYHRFTCAFPVALKDLEAEIDSKLLCCVMHENLETGRKTWLQTRSIFHLATVSPKIEIQSS